MPNIEVNSDNLSVVVKYDELTPLIPAHQGLRFSIGYVEYPVFDAPKRFPEIHGNDLANIVISIKPSLENFEGDEQLLTLKNSIQLDLVNSSYVVCLLDEDGDGIISTLDVENLFRRLFLRESKDPAYDYNGDGVVDVTDMLLAMNFVGEECITDPPPPTNVEIPDPVFKINAQDFIDGSNGDWKLGWVDNWADRQVNDTSLAQMDSWRNSAIATTGNFRDYIQYCYDNGFIDSVDKYYDPSLPVGSPRFDADSFSNTVFDYNTFRQTARFDGVHSMVTKGAELRYDHNYTYADRPIDNEFSVSFWWYWDSSQVPDGYTWRDVHNSGYGVGASGPVEAWIGTANYITTNFLENDGPDVLVFGRTNALHLWSISGLVNGYPLNQIMDIDAYTEQNGLTYVNDRYPDRIENRCFMRYDLGYSRLWFTGGGTGGATGTTNSSYAQLASIYIDPDQFWQEDKWHNIVITKKRMELAKCYFDGNLIGTMSSASPIGYQWVSRPGPLVTPSGEPVYKYEVDTNPQMQLAEDVCVGGPGWYVSNLDRGPGQWDPSLNGGEGGYWGGGAGLQPNFYGQNAGNFIGKTNAFKVWDEVLDYQQIRKIYLDGAILNDSPE